MNKSKEMKITWAIVFVLWIIGILYTQDIKAWIIKPFQEQNQKSYSEKFQKYMTNCPKCKGTGEYPTDVNKLMMDNKLALFINKHLVVGKCKKCVKLPYGDTYDYCNTVQNKYQILVQEYGAVGPKIEMSICDKCEEYKKKHK